MKNNLKMKGKKSVAFLIMCAGISVTMLKPIEVCATELTDIANHWGKSNIEFMQEKGAISGYPDGTFKPDNKVSYGETMKLVIASYEKDIQNASTHWANNYLKYAEDKKIVPKGLYSQEILDKQATRKEVAYMISQSLINLAYKPIIVNNEITLPFPDVDKSINSTNINYVDAIKTCYLLGIVQGDENGKMNPDALVTRAEIVTMLARAYSEEKRVYPMINSTLNLNEYGRTLAYMPKSFYEAGKNTFAKYDSNVTPNKFLYQQRRDVGDAALEVARKDTETVMNALLNVSYKMTEKEWDVWKKEIQNFSDIVMTLFYDEEKSLEDYINYVKENRIIIRGGTIINPVTLGRIYLTENSLQLALKGYVDYEVVENPTRTKILTIVDYIKETGTISEVNNPKYIVMGLYGYDNLTILKELKCEAYSIKFIGE